MPDSDLLLLLQSTRDRDVYRIELTWNWSALKGLAPSVEVSSRIQTLQPLLQAVRGSYPRAYVLTNDEVFEPNKIHRHLEGVSGNLDASVLAKYTIRIVPVEYTWGRLDVGPNRWSYLIDLQEGGLEHFTRGLIGMSMNPLCYNFLFTGRSVEIDQILNLLSESGDRRQASVGDWERRLFSAIGLLLFPREETFLTIKTADRTVVSEILRTFRTSETSSRSV